jgi:hypothetical protein
MTTPALYRIRPPGEIKYAGKRAFRAEGLIILILILILILLILNQMNPKEIKIKIRIRIRNGRPRLWRLPVHRPPAYIASG